MGVNVGSMSRLYMTMSWTALARDPRASKDYMQRLSLIALVMGTLVAGTERPTFSECRLEN